MIDLNNLQVATTKTARDINRRTVLNLIRKHQPISRADISRLSRLQRSTVSAIIEQSIAERWVTTGACGDLPRGRKPTFLHLNGDRAGIIGVDIRPLQTSLVLADLDMRFLAEESIQTNRDPSALAAQLGAQLTKMINAHPQVAVEGIGIVSAGRVDLPTGRLTYPPGFWTGPVDLKGPIEEATGLPVKLENVANACALAEILGGSQLDGSRNFIAVTVSENIGVGIVFNGQLVRGVKGRAGEFGHVSIGKDGPACPCGNRGCFEVCASNSAVVRRFNELAGYPGGDANTGEISFDTILNLAQQGHVHATRALNEMAHSLGMGLAMMITGLAPDVVIVVGELTRAWDQLGPIVDEVVRGQVRTRVPTRIMPAAAGVRSRLRGAVALILKNHFGAVQPI